MSNYWNNVLRGRVTRRHGLAIAGAGVGGAAFLAACGGGSSSSGEKKDHSSLVTPAIDESKNAKRGGTWLDSQTADFVSFDPHFTALPHPSRFLFSTLMRIKPGLLEPAKGDYMLDAAASYELSPDHLTLTMKLRPNHKWHNIAPVNGRQVEADDVVFSYERLIKQGSNRGNFAGSLGGPIDSLKATDKSTIVIKLNQVYAGILALLAGGGSGNLLLMPKEADGGYDPRRTGIGSGPWVAAEYQPSVGTTYKRHEGWYDTSSLYVDQINSPIVSQYATGLAQFIKGAIYRFLVNSNDIIQTKNDQPLLSLYQNEVAGGGPIFFYGWNPALGAKTPMRDQRLRQAFSMSWDRDLWIDAFYDVEKFRGLGFDVRTSWNTALPSNNTGWWMDPQGKEFGPNARYFKHDPAEAKKMVAAAGFANGLDIEAHYINSSNYGLDFQKRITTLLNMSAEVGLKTTYYPADFATDWVPKYQDAKGDFAGLSARNLASGNPDVGEKAIQVFTPDAGILYTGFFSGDSSFQKGDPKMTSLLMKTRAEFDQDKRVGLMKDFQRMAAETQYIAYVPGGASSFTLAWPVLRNQNIYQGEVVPYVRQWLDPTKPPLNKA